MTLVSGDTNLTLYFTFSLHLVRNAQPLNLASCSLEKKKVMYNISKTAFASQSSSSSAYYTLIKPSLGKNTYSFFSLSLSFVKLFSNFLFSFIF